MYIKNTNVHEVYFKNKVLLVNLNNGQWVRTSRKYFEVLNKLVESNQIGDLMKYKYVSNVIDNLKRLFNELLEIRYYVDEEKTHQENNLSVTFTLTNKCNLSCSHCALSASPLSQDILSTNDVKYAIDKIIDVNPNTLILTGGEPFIRNDILEIISYIRTNFKNKLVIMTNGMLIRKKFIPFLKENVDALDISLDGYDRTSVEKIRGKKVFSLVEKKINMLIEEGYTNISLSMVLTRDNYNHRIEFENICRKLNVKSIFRPYHPEGRAISQIDSNALIPTDIIFEDIACHYCKPGIREFVINFNGDIFPCTNLINKDFKIGNIFNDSDILKKLTQQSINFNHIFNTINRLRPLNDKHCRNCKVNLFCWECPSRFQSIKRNSNKLNEFCEFKKRRLYKEIWGESI